MELGILFLIIFGIRLLGWLLSVGARAAGGNGSSGTDLSVFDVRLKDGHLGDNGEGPAVKRIEAQGLFPVRQRVRMGFVTSIFDRTSGVFEPVLSVLEKFQEAESVVYQHRIEVGSIEPNHGFTDWVRLGVVIPEILQPPYGGRRKLVAVIRMVDLDNLPDIEYGFDDTDNSPGILWQKVLPFSHLFDEKGYREVADRRDEAMALVIRIGVAVAMADGTLDDSEGNVLNSWIRRMLESFSGERQETLKALCNNAMKEAFSEQRSGSLSLNAVTSKLNEIGERATKYEAIELCFDVLAADGVADSEEIKIIRKIAEALDLDMDEVEKMRDQAIVGLDAQVSAGASIEELLGIEPDWSKAKVRGHLLPEFQKWNNRLNTLAEGAERANAQRMLDLIADARRRNA